MRVTAKFGTSSKCVQEGQLNRGVVCVEQIRMGCSKQQGKGGGGMMDMSLGAQTGSPRCSTSAGVDGVISELRLQGNRVR